MTKCLGEGILRDLRYCTVQHENETEHVLENHYILSMSQVEESSSLGGKMISKKKKRVPNFTPIDKHIRNVLCAGWTYKYTTNTLQTLYNTLHAK
jgi:hypothetical protein